MNRKKALLLLLGMETLLLTLLSTLYTSGKIGVDRFIAAILLVSVLALVAIFVILKKMSN